ncbi:S1 family peptidase [Nostoc sp.]|uniref:S1 family peptidase n=1 Tax=Nostoc sp. TaxID=1180 RepID=UPI002FFC2491
MNLRLLILFASMAGLLAIEAVNSSVFAQITSTRKTHEELIVKQLQQYAKSITVKVISNDSWGSGVIIQRKGKVYLVLTNEHVLSRGKQHRIQVADGSIYSTSLLPSIGSNDDLGLIQFYSPSIVYPVAVLKQTSRLEVGNRIFAAGFPFDINLSKSGKFEFTTGKISDLLKQPLIGGYQIGYTNNVKRGMSGGPLLDIQGEVVGINGMPKYPLLGNPYVFKDGSTVSEVRWQEMSHLSWAVPIPMFLHLL